MKGPFWNRLDPDNTVSNDNVDEAVLDATMGVIDTQLWDAMSPQEDLEAIIQTTMTTTLESPFMLDTVKRSLREFITHTLSPKISMLPARSMEMSRRLNVMSAMAGGWMGGVATVIDGVEPETWAISSPTDDVADHALAMACMNEPWIDVTELTTRDVHDYVEHISKHVDDSAAIYQAAYGFVVGHASASKGLIDLTATGPVAKYRDVTRGIVEDVCEAACDMVLKQSVNGNHAIGLFIKTLDEDLEQRGQAGPKGAYDMVLDETTKVVTDATVNDILPLASQPRNPNGAFTLASNYAGTFLTSMVIESARLSNVLNIPAHPVLDRAMRAESIALRNYVEAAKRPRPSEMDLWSAVSRTTTTVHDDNDNQRIYHNRVVEFLALCSIQATRKPEFTLSDSALLPYRQAMLHALTHDA